MLARRLSPDSTGGLNASEQHYSQAGSVLSDSAHVTLSPKRPSLLPSRSAMQLSFFTALTIGFLGSTHCVGMCGGIVGALNAGLNDELPRHRGQPRFPRFAYHFVYNAGRILSYSVAGAIAGLAGAQSAKIPLGLALPVGGVIAGLFMIALGLYLAGWWPAFAGVEKAGQYVWKYIQPLGKTLLPVKSPLHALGLGLVWGWLPCGLVYSALALALLSASPTQGALLMLGFGLGTLPMLLAMGRAYEYLGRAARKPVVRRLAGVAVILFGVYTLLTVGSGRGPLHASTGHASRELQAGSRFKTAGSLLLEEGSLVAVTGAVQVGS